MILILTALGLWIEISNRPGKYKDWIVPSTGAAVSGSADDDATEPPLIDINHEGISLSDRERAICDAIQPWEIVVWWCCFVDHEGNTCRHETIVTNDSDSIAAFVLPSFILRLQPGRSLIKTTSNLLFGCYCRYSVLQQHTVLFVVQINTLFIDVYLEVRPYQLFGRLWFQHVEVWNRTEGRTVFWRHKNLKLPRRICHILYDKLSHKV